MATKDGEHGLGCLGCRVGIYTGLTGFESVGSKRFKRHLWYEVHTIAAFENLLTGSRREATTGETLNHEALKPYTLKACAARNLNSKEPRVAGETTEKLQDEIGIAET